MRSPEKWARYISGVCFLLSPAAVMQRKEEFSFLLFGFLTDPVHINSEESKQASRKIMGYANKFSLYRSSMLWVRRGKWNSGCQANIKITHKWVVNCPVKKVTTSLYEMFEWHNIIQELLAVECCNYNNITSCIVQKQREVSTKYYISLK